MNNDYLIHFGTKEHSGRFPWGSGKRPFQRLPGKNKVTYKKASELSDDELAQFNKRRKLEKVYKDNVKQLEGPDKLETAESLSRMTDNVVTNVTSQVNKLYNDKHRQDKSQIDLSSVSDEDLRRIVNRMNLEQQYRNLSPTYVSKGEVAVKEGLAAIGALSSLTASGLGIALAIKKLRGA